MEGLSIVLAIILFAIVFSYLQYKFSGSEDDYLEYSKKKNRKRRDTNSSDAGDDFGGGDSGGGGD